MRLAFHYVIFLAAAVTSGEGLSDVIMWLSYEGRKDYIIDFKFNSEVFALFYQCLCKDETSRCLMSYDYNKTVQSVISESTDEALLPPCKLYSCQNSGQSTSVICSSLKQTNTCARLVNPTFVTLDLASSCSASCVGIAWNLDNEKLIINDPQLRVRECGNVCCPGASSVEPPSRNESSPEQLSIFETVVERDYKDMYIVSGIAAGVVFIAVVLFVTFFLLKRQSDSSCEQRGVSNAAQSSTNGANHSFFPNNAVIRSTHTHAHDDGSHTNRQLQPANPFAGIRLANTEHTPEVQYNTETSNITNKSINDKKDNKSKTRGMRLFKRESSNTSERNNEGFSDGSTSNHDFEGDYAEIDDSHIQNCNPLEHIPDFADIDLIDGYSSVDNNDYYNINNTTLGSADGNSSGSREGSADLFSSKEASLHGDSNREPRQQSSQPTNITGQNHQFSEYSIAQEISDDTSTEHGQKDHAVGGTVAYSMGQLMDGPSSDREILEQQQDNTSGSDSSRRKRNSYFMLEKESEDQDI